MYNKKQQCQSVDTLFSILLMRVTVGSKRIHNTTANVHFKLYDVHHTHTHYTPIRRAIVAKLIAAAAEMVDVSTQTCTALPCLRSSSVVVVFEY